MASVITSSSPCPCSSPSTASHSSSASFSSLSSASALSPAPPDNRVVSRRFRLLAAAVCACHCQHQNQRPNSAALSVKPILLSTRRRKLLPCPRAELNSDTILAVSVGVAGIALGIGIPIFYETQVKGSEDRENDQPCFPCNGSGSQVCRFCVGAGDITVELGAGEREVSKCINCEGAGNITCTTCQGSGVQPRYLDRREYKDED